MAIDLWQKEYKAISNKDHFFGPFQLELAKNYHYNCKLYVLFI